MPKIMASKMSLFGLPMATSMKIVREAGFCGIEITLSRLFENRVKRWQELAEKTGLELHFHQGWSADEDPTDWRFKVLEWMGYLPKHGYVLGDHIPYDLVNIPTVIQADRLNELYRHNDLAPSYWFQTDCIWDGSKPKLLFSEFIRIVNEHHLPVVFDTQHYLEWRLSVFRDLTKLPTNPKRIFSLLEEGWGILGSNTKEIHLNDWRPETRNVFPGTGIAPLREFGCLVKSMDWNGYVVPEISPNMPFPHSTKTMTILRKKVENYFV